eukprot:TRINITY_DN3558_c0_g1_i2.p2 TRINITY_DN3558_c0_g1~~TRINITY_DN3558_c0_g1_i2.p2  ORF type:complete len:371 (+),score=118.08 TRINITY_DN3558_c0_g1_i2:2119-3231(+)
MDKYSQKFSYSELKTCGLVSTGTASGMHIFNDTLLIERDYVIKKGTFQVDRVNAMERKFALEFPTAIIATQSVQVKDFEGFFGTWSNVRYDHSTSTWKLTLSTISNTPYYVTFHSASDPFATGNNREFSTPAANSPTSEPTCTGDCLQSFDFSAKLCDKIDFTNLKIKFNLECRTDSSGCVSSTVYATVSLTTTDACPVNADFTNTQMDIQASTDPSPPTGGIYPSTQLIKFFVDYTLPSSVSASAKVVKVCAYTGTKKDVCPEDANAVTFTKIEGADLGGKDAGYSVNAGDLKVAAGVTNTDAFTVHADLALTYSDISTKRSVENTIAKSASSSIRVNDEAVEELSLASSASSLPVLFALFSFAALFAV